LIPPGHVDDLFKTSFPLLTKKQQRIKRAEDIKEIKRKKGLLLLQLNEETAMMVVNKKASAQPVSEEVLSDDRTLDSL
jgi:hypothetical protein